MDASMELELMGRFYAVLPWILWRLPLAAMLAIWAVCAVRRPEKRRGLLALFGAAAALAAVLFGGLWALGPGEEVGTYHGRTVVQGRWTWMETSYSLYEYHGPLVRGKEPVIRAEGSLLDGADSAEGPSGPSAPPER